MINGCVLIMKICSWNVNGIRAIQKKGFIKWVEEQRPDIICLQEIKANVEQLDDELLNVNGYRSFWNPAKRKGYSGVATYIREDLEPDEAIMGLGIDKFDNEGRLMLFHFEQFSLLNIYFPNGGRGDDRVEFKLEFYEEVIKSCDILREKGERLIICGDFNTAHHEIDLKNPKANEKTSGFLPVEREMLDKFLSHGYLDIYRCLYPEETGYTWWSYRTRARERNAGWRIDYFYISSDLINEVVDCSLLNEVQGSDHCPLILELNFS